jgi:prevent-host-death family protein
MREIGVRELKRTLSETLGAVGRGEPVRVTRRGRPLADLLPAGAAAGEDPLWGLVAAGRVMAPVRPRPAHTPRLVSPVGRLASELVLAERELER